MVQLQKKSSLILQERFGPEYGRSVDDLGCRTKAESELKAREKRVVAQIRKATRRKYSTDEKIPIILEGLRGEIPISELCRGEELARTLLPCLARRRMGEVRTDRKPRANNRYLKRKIEYPVQRYRWTGHGGAGQ
jgi:transposase-like protein